MLSRNLRVLALSVLLSTLAIGGAMVNTVSAQDSGTGVALQRGYRTGYSDGYMAGYRDTIDSVARDYVRHADYSKADRAFNKDYGTIDDYRDGYQQGFEAGYDTGYERRSFEQALPTGLAKRGIRRQQEPVPSTATTGELEAVNTEPGTSDNKPAVDAYIPVNSEPSAQTSVPADDGVPAVQALVPAYSNATVIIPRDTELIVELQEDLSTQNNREGERFTAKIVSPSEIAGATVEGRVSKVRQPGRIKRRSELLLSFDRILLSDNRWSNISATMTEVMPVKGDNIRRVDVEGTAVGKSSMKSDATKIGGATGAGLMVGAIVGGPVGAAVGAGVGAAFGVGAVVIDRGNHIRLNRNQQLRIKTAYETQIR